MYFCHSNYGNKTSIMKSIIGRNLTTFRKANNFNQDQVASFLGITRSAYSNYELGIREPSIDILEKAASLFGCELSTFFEEDEKAVNNMLVGAFRIDSLNQHDMNEIADFKKIVMNYLKMEKLLSK